jgi:hypothetical protein
MQVITSLGIVLDVAALRALFRILTLLVLIVIASPQRSEAASTDLGDDDVARLRRGEILLQTILEEKSGGAARVTALFHSDVNTIWNIIGYCKYEFIYVRGLKLCEVLVPGQYYTEVHHRVRSSWYTPTMDFTFEASRTSPTHGEFHLLGGDLEVMEGQWNFVPLADTDSIIVIHEIRIQPRIPSPKWLVRRVLKNDLPDMLACMRGLAKASGDDDRLVDDLRRCPGDTAGATK